MSSSPAPIRGYVTIATGSEHYYKIAYNLLLSYRRNGGNAYPFAILAEEENEYTRAFDKVVVISDPSRSYMDKLRIYDYTPFEETIFIDADCLVYGNIDSWWSFFENSGDFSCFGYAYENLSTKKGWFRWEGMKEFKDRISFIPSFSGGVYYLRKTPVAGEVFHLAKYAATHYKEYPFAMFSAPADEPVLAFGMAVCNCRPIDRTEVGIYVKQRDMHVDIMVPSALWANRGKIIPVKLVHWGNFGTMKAQYLLEALRLKRDLQGKFTSRLGAKLRYLLLLRYDCATLVKRINRRLRKRLNKHRKQKAVSKIQ